uniref:Succinate dehydrogenase [ubiquinone] cytochrome b small subunit n=1 Tax=Corethron hystrix TaxID=216773 RepID=A0A6U5M0U0_9STRA|mmetsp:Transcript_7401/g.16014  ORF Transcript_7401/g.16014 Transcript_7401/m.16014 type:complete len:145 (+) Transcript_7401:167-601(+)
MISSVSRTSMQLCRPLPAFVGRSVRNIGTAAADTGKTGTHLYHSINGLLAIAFPIAVLSDGRSVTGKTAGVFTAGAVSFHSWVGLHYVITDYAPKISKKIAGPARILAAGLSAVTALGLTKMALSDGGFNAQAKALWTKKKEKK